MGEDERLSAVNDELELLLDELRSFRANHQIGVHRKCISNLYYAAFHATRALLFSHGLESKTHEGTQRLFAAHFVRSGAFDRQHLKTLGQLEADRHRADDQGFHQFDAQDVARAHAPVMALVAVVMDDLEIRVPASIESIAPAIRVEIAGGG
jgi:uncharacterized protein (UPF0332 family)